MIWVLTKCIIYPIVERNAKWKSLLSGDYSVDYAGRNGIWQGDFLSPHYALLESFAGMLSPDEGMFVLMHALSSDARATYAYTQQFVEEANSLDTFSEDGYFFNGCDLDILGEWFDRLYERNQYK